MTRNVIVFLGAPGSGKGTQAKLAATRIGIPHISTGDMLRSAIAEGSELGNRVRDILESGALVSDDIMKEVVRTRLAKSDCREGLILDGYPRTMRQVKDLESILEKESVRPIVILLDVSRETIRRRLVGRRSCPSCGKVYNIFENPSPRGDSCDVCGTDLVQRQDDGETVVEQRLKIYHQQTEPLVLYYKGLDRLHPVAGERSLEEIHEDIVRVVYDDRLSLKN